MEVKPLTPLSHGNVLIVGTMMSNFGPEIKEHPRVILWPSDNQHWIGKSLPDNVRAIFITRFIGHAAFTKIQTEARKKRLTIFNPQGTGLIAKQVKELLGMERTITVTDHHDIHISQPVIQVTEENTMPKKPYVKAKLKPLHEFIDFNLGDAENGRALLIKAKELGIDTTFDSLCQMVMTQRRKNTLTFFKPKKEVVKSDDILIATFDNLIKGLTDIRDAYIATVEENNTLKARMAQFRKLVE